MKKFSIYLFLIIVFFITSLIIVLSTIGIETSKFNKLISEKVSKTKNIFLDLKTIKFKIDLKELSLFLVTQNPKITYKNVKIPVENVKVYIDFLSLLKSEIKIEKTNLILKELDITELKKLSIMIKPSNFKSLLNNKIKKGKIVSEINFFINEQGSLNDFIAKGKVKDLELELMSNLYLRKTNLNFFADNNDILIKNIFGNIENIKISEGDIKLNLENGIKLSSNFNSELNFDKKTTSKYTQFLKKNNFIHGIENLNANFDNNLFIKFDPTYKVKDYNYSISGNLKKSKYRIQTPIENNYVIEKIKEFYFSNLKIKTVFSPNKISFNGIGKYSLNNSDYYQIELKSSLLNNQLSKLKLDFDYGNSFIINLINYKKSKNSLSNIVFDLEKNNDIIDINKFHYNEGKNSIKINDLKLKKNKFLSFKKIIVLTSNNDFFIQNEKKILIEGSKFDATNLSKFFNVENNENLFTRLNSNIEIDFKNIKVTNSENLKNFKLIGYIKKGQFTKISAKGDFGNNNFLDISMKKDQTSDKKYLEIYSDLPQPLLTEHNFFKGLTGGTLLFTSIIDGQRSNSKLKIEKFKIVNAPGVVKLLSLADLGGLADLAEGDGLSFDVLEIEMEKNKNSIKLNEILALGPSMSVLMEGYQDDKGLTSLRGTLVPAKTLNKMISKIPVIGNIVIPKEIGEGLFGISFKMKGPKGNIKTTINPIRTLTPRFIQKIIDKNKVTK
tara:strand:- start:6712 stop:8886 length:2175 start_codon:yes stop_codon:yes gene_type:complete